MSRNLVVADASVVIPWMHEKDELFVRECLGLYHDFLSGSVRIAIPQLFFHELSNFAVVRGRKGKFPLDHLEKIFFMDFLVYDLKPVNFVEISRLAYAKAVTAYDAAYLYVADILEVPFLTADEQMVRAWGNRQGGHIRNYRNLTFN